MTMHRMTVVFNAVAAFLLVAFNSPTCSHAVRLTARSPGADPSPATRDFHRSSSFDDGRSSPSRKRKTELYAVGSVRARFVPWKLGLKVSHITKYGPAYADSRGATVRSAHDLYPEEEEEKVFLSQEEEDARETHDTSVEALMFYPCEPQAAGSGGESALDLRGMLWPRGSQYVREDLVSAYLDHFLTHDSFNMKSSSNSKLDKIDRITRVDLGSLPEWLGGNRLVGKDMSFLRRMCVKSAQRMLLKSKSPAHWEAPPLGTDGSGDGVARDATSENRKFRTLVLEGGHMNSPDMLHQLGMRLAARGVIVIIPHFDDRTVIPAPDVVKVAKRGVSEHGNEAIKVASVTRKEEPLASLPNEYFTAENGGLLEARSNQLDILLACIQQLHAQQQRGILDQSSKQAILPGSTKLGMNPYYWRRTQNVVTDLTNLMDLEFGFGVSGYSWGGMHAATFAHWRWQRQHLQTHVPYPSTPTRTSQHPLLPGHGYVVRAFVGIDASNWAFREKRLKKHFERNGAADILRLIDKPMSEYGQQTKDDIAKDPHQTFLNNRRMLSFTATNRVMNYQSDVVEPEKNFPYEERHMRYQLLDAEHEDFCDLHFLNPFKRSETARRLNVQIDFMALQTAEMLQMSQEDYAAAQREYDAHPYQWVQLETGQIEERLAKLEQRRLERKQRRKQQFLNS